MFGDSYGRRYGASPAAWTPDAWPSVVFDMLLFTLFAMHHSLFARTGVKQLVTRAVSAESERTVYVWVASVLLVGTCWWWHPVPGVAWHIGGAGALAGWTSQAIGVLISIRGAAQIDALELAGMRQTMGPSARRPGIIDTGLYSFVRHPIYFGWLLLVWPTPLMTGTRLVFAVVSTCYLIVAVPFEERDLRATFGPAYAAYAKRVRWRMVPFLY